MELIPTTTGGFRVQKRTGEHYEVYFKNFKAGTMLLVAEGLTKEQAETLKERLNDTLYGDIRELKNEPTKGV